MSIDKSKLKEPPNTKENREKLADTILYDMPIIEIRARVKNQLVHSYKVSTRTFLKEYWKYYEETWGHCPLGMNND
jgi:hypothetical protein